MFADLSYRSEYAKSSTSTCRKCGTKIESKSLRLAKMVQSFQFDGLEPNWYHYECFFDVAKPKGPEQIDCFEYLSFVDQRKILASIAEEDTDDPPRGTKRTILDDELQRQSDDLYFYIDKLVGKRELSEKFEINLEAVSPDSFKQVYYIADSLLFGKPKKCPDCSKKLSFKLGRYVCTGSPYCPFSTEDPERKPFQIPKDLTKKKPFSFLNDYVFVSRKRVIDPILMECFEFRRNQVLNSINVDKVKRTSTSGEVYKCEPDPCFDLENVKILKDDEGYRYNAILIKVDIFENVISYCKIQLLVQLDGDSKKYWVCTLEGRIGTSINIKKRTDFFNKQQAIKQFELGFFKSRTAEYWDSRLKNRILPDKYFYFHQDTKLESLDFNVPVYLPFGMPSKSRLKSAHSELQKISQFGKVNFENVHEFTRLWNNFYAVFPQSFGTVQDARPALIIDPEQIVKKVEIIDQLIKYGDLD